MFDVDGRIVPSEHQMLAVRAAGTWWRDSYKGALSSTFFIGGYAGTGKSTILPFLLEIMGLSPHEVAFCAPTGKAAKVMTNSLKRVGIHETAKTIHSLIYIPLSEEHDAILTAIETLNLQAEFKRTSGRSGKESMDPEIRALELPQIEKEVDKLEARLQRLLRRNDGPQWRLRHRDEFPSDKRLIICDEGSMVGQDILNDLRLFQRPILGMGDPGQLPPVNAEYGFDVLNPDAFLTEIHRQAAESPIIRLATEVRLGGRLKVGDYSKEVRVIRKSGGQDEYTTNPDHAAVVLCGQNKTRFRLTKEIREAFGIKGIMGPMAGEPLICCKNNKEIPGMVNGGFYYNLTDTPELEFGATTVNLSIEDGDGEEVYEVRALQQPFESQFSGNANTYSCTSSQLIKAKKYAQIFDFAHVITTHKAQGSQFDSVVVHDESAVFREDKHKWLYTAITRAERELIVVK